MVNSCEFREQGHGLNDELQTDLFDSHNNLNSVQAIKTKVTRERSLGSEL